MKLVIFYPNNFTHVSIDISPDLGKFVSNQYQQTFNLNTFDSTFVIMMFLRKQGDSVVVGIARNRTQCA